MTKGKTMGISIMILGLLISYSAKEINMISKTKEDEIVNLKASSLKQNENLESASIRLGELQEIESFHFCL